MVDTQSIKDRIILALEKTGKSQRDLARAMGKASPTVSEMLSKPGDIDSVSYIDAAAKLTGYSFEWIRTGGEMMVPNVQETSVEYLKGKNVRPITVTVDRSGNELITYVPVKAQAGYMRGYSDSHYIEKLPAFSLPVVDAKGTMRMFQVNGDSMLQLGGGGLHDGDVVVAQYVEDILSLKDNRVYVVVGGDGIVVKRVINRLPTSDKVLILKSDNKNGNHPDQLLRAKDILEVWELKAFISRQLSFSTDLWEVINDLQAKMAIVNERVDKIEGPRKLKS